MLFRVLGWEFIEWACFHGVPENIDSVGVKNEEKILRHNEVIEIAAVVERVFLYVDCLVALQGVWELQNLLDVGIRHSNLAQQNEMLTWYQVEGFAVCYLSDELWCR